MSTGIQPQNNLASALTAETQISIVNKPKSQRIPELDFVKGALVLIMVIYHWINYFIGPDWKYYPYLRFLTPSFIFISGFMISHVYLSKYAPEDPRLWRRLFSRGFKLLMIFILLNVGRALIAPVLGTSAVSLKLFSIENISTIFVSGNLPVTGAKIVSFSILVPISYLLMIAGLLMVPYRQNKYVFHVVCVALLLFITGLKFFGAESYNLEFITIGLIGLLSGFAPVSVLKQIVRHPVTLLIAYLFYVVAITIWNVPFVLLIAGVFLSLMVLYAIGFRMDKPGSIKDEVILLGKYSLLGYLSQVFILQVLSVGFARINLGAAARPFSFLVALVLTIVSIEATDRARKKSTTVNGLYRAVFS